MQIRANIDLQVLFLYFFRETLQNINRLSVTHIVGLLWCYTLTEWYDIILFKAKWQIFEVVLVYCHDLINIHLS